MHVLENVLRFLSEKLRMVGAVFLFGMALLTFADIVGRMFGRPIFGAVELVSFMAVIVVATALPVTQMDNGHIGVELFVNKLPRRGRLFVEVLTQLCSLALFGVVSWRMFLFAGKLQRSGEVSLNLHLPEYLIVFFLACCAVLLCLVLLLAVAESFNKLVR